MTLAESSNVVSGFCLLLFALRHLTESLAREVDRNLSYFLEKINRNSLTALCSGTIATVFVQAGSVTILSTMGFLSRGLITLDRAILMMLGAAFGSTLKGWISSEVTLAIGPAFLLIGSIGLVTTKNLRHRHLFEATVSIGMTFLGLHLIERGLAPLTQTHFVHQLLGSTPHTGETENFSILRTIFFGFILATLLQSSSSVLLLVAHFSGQGMISLPAAMGLLLGANVGSTTTPLFASLGRDNTDAKKLAYSYFLIKASGVVLVFTYFRTHVALLQDIGKLLGLSSRPEILTVAFHTWFNLMNAMSWWILLPLLLKVLNQISSQDQSSKGPSALSEQILKLLENLPDRALLESVSRFQEVVRELHWVSDSIFHIAESKGNPKQYSDLIEKSLTKCEKSTETLDTMRTLAWMSLKNQNFSPVATEAATTAREKIHNLIAFTADLKNIECILSSCLRSMDQEAATQSRGHESKQAIAQRFGILRAKLNESWEQIYSADRFTQPVPITTGNLPLVHPCDEAMPIQLIELSCRLNRLQPLMVNEVSQTRLLAVSTPPSGPIIGADPLFQIRTDSNREVVRAP